MELRVVIRQRIIAGMVSERSFQNVVLVRIHITFNDDIGVGGNLYVPGEALYQLNFFFRKKSGKHVFIDPIRQRRGRTVGISRVATQGYGHRHLFAAFLVFLHMAGADLMPVPMHTGQFGPKYLHPVHADIANARYRILRVDHRQG